MRNELTNWIFKNLSFVFFLSALGLVYIFNAHKAEKKLREIQVLKQEVSDSKNHYHKIKSEIMYESTESQLAKELIEKDLKSNDDVPVVIKQG